MLWDKMPGDVVGVFRDCLNKHLPEVPWAARPHQEERLNDLLQSLPAVHCVIPEWVSTGWEELFIFWCWGIQGWLRATSFSHGSECSVILCRIWQSHPAAIHPVRGFLKAWETLETPWAISGGGNAARGTSFTLLARNRGFEPLSVEILQKKRCPGARGEKKLLAVLTHSCSFQHFSRQVWWRGCAGG